MLDNSSDALDVFLKNIQIPEIDQSYLDKIELDEQGNIKDDSFIKINDDEINRAIDDYQKSPNKDKKIIQEVEDSVSDDFLKIDQDYDSKKNEITDQINKQEEANLQLRKLFEEVKEKNNEFISKKKRIIEDANNQIKETKDKIEDTNVEISAASDRLKELRNNDSKDTDQNLEIPDIDPIYINKKEVGRAYKEIFSIVPDLNTLFKDIGLKSKIDPNSDDNINIESLKDIKSSTEKAVDLIYQEF